MALLERYKHALISIKIWQIWQLQPDDFVNLSVNIWLVNLKWKNYIQIKANAMENKSKQKKLDIYFFTV